MGKTWKIDDFWMTSLVLILLYLNEMTDIWKRSIDPLSLILHLKIINQLFFHLHMCSAGYFSLFTFSGKHLLTVLTFYLCLIDVIVLGIMYGL